MSISSRTWLELQHGVYNLLERGWTHLAPQLSRFMRIPPHRITLLLTNSCNLRCRSCFVSDSLNQEVPAPLNTSEWIRILSSVRRPTIVDLVGGEVFLHPGFQEILDFCRSRKLMTVVTTNGTLLEPARLRWIVDSNVHLLQISVDGLAATHDAYRGRPGLFARIDRALHELGQLTKGRPGKPQVAIKLLVLNENVAELPALIDHFEGIPIVQQITISLGVTNPHQHGFRVETDLKKVLQTGENSFRYSDDAMAVFTERFDELAVTMRRSRLKILLKPELSSRAEYADYLRDPNSRGVPSCSFPNTSFNIHPGGEVTPCLSYALGNIRDFGYDVNSVLFTEKHREFVGSLRRTPFCGACNGCVFGNQEKK